MPQSHVTLRYAKSIFDLAQKSNILENVKQDFLSISEIGKNKDFRNMLKSPIIKADKKKACFNALFGQSLNHLTNEFLKLIIQKGREDLLLEITSDFDYLYNENKGILKVKVTSTIPLDDAAKNNISIKVKEFVKKDMQIQFTEIIDPNIIGGFIIQFEDKLFDQSILYQLNKVKKEFSKN